MGKEQEQPSFFDPDDFKLWKKEWQDMPEYISENQNPFQSILVHFETEEDRKDFAELVEQFISKDTRYIWYPKAKIESVINKRYVDELRRKRKQ